MIARALWQRMEAIHAVTYFAEESRDAARHAGLRGFWMGYFAFRAAPLGTVSAGAVEAIFANFAPRMVQRAVPEAWSVVTPADAVTLRREAAAAALRRLHADAPQAAAQANDHLAAVIDAAASIGRPLFAANRDLPRPQEPIECLWQLCTTLREHRGDGHVAALAAAGVDGLAAHLLISAEQGIPLATFVDNRGWNEAEVGAAAERLVARGLLVEGVLSDAGRAVRAAVEETTDLLAQVPIDAALDAGAQQQLLAVLGPVAAAASAVIPFPNPMGLTRIES